MKKKIPGLWQEIALSWTRIKEIFQGSSRSDCLGFEIKNDGKFSTKVKGGFGVASDWPHLNLLACKVGLGTYLEEAKRKRSHRSSEFNDIHQRRTF